jgi:copper resistance protein C
VPPDGGERELRLEDEGRPNVMKSKAANLFPGVYILRWYVLSSDGHITRGTIPFRVIDR